MLVEIQDGYITCRWSDFYTNTKSMGQWACESKGSRGHKRIATHKVREKANSAGCYYMEKILVGILMNIRYQP